MPWSLAQGSVREFHLRGHQIFIQFLLSTTQDPLVHHGRHFGRAIHTFCNLQTLISNGLVLMGDGADDHLEEISEE